jgi:NTP pyrophosphatase (non-canonical NTP hydrolase)
MSDTRTVLEDVGVERARQEQRKAEGRFTHTCANPSPGAMTNAEKLTVLVEEVGEVAREVLTQDGRRLARDTIGTREALRMELVQVAAVAVAWVEALDAEEVFAVLDARDECYAIRDTYEAAVEAVKDAHAYLAEARDCGHPDAGPWVRERLPIRVEPVSRERAEAIRAEGVPVLEREP